MFSVLQELELTGRAQEADRAARNFPAGRDVGHSRESTRGEVSSRVIVEEDVVYGVALHLAGTVKWDVAETQHQRRGM